MRVLEEGYVLVAGELVVPLVGAMTRVAILTIWFLDQICPAGPIC